jgi:3-isopropylmalate/(R)-2-methylmalate dehydratase small subunit
MKRVSTITGRAVPLDRSDVDTDQIIPARWLKRVERAGFGEGLFEQWRSDPDFVLNRPEFKGAVILVTGPNFGTGSSREHAVWALLDYGITAVVSPRFGDIFHNNCTKNGLVPVTVSPEIGGHLLDAISANPRLEFTVDVGRLTLRAPALDLEVPFPMAPGTQERFLEGLDDIVLTLRHIGDIDAYERARASWLPAVHA